MLSRLGVHEKYLKRNITWQSILQPGSPRLVPFSVVLRCLCITVEFQPLVVLMISIPWGVSGLPASQHVVSPPVCSSYNTHNIYKLFNFYTITQKSNLNCCYSIIPLQRSQTHSNFKEIVTWTLSSRFRRCCSLGSCRHGLCSHIKIEASKCTKRVRHVQACNDKWVPHKALHMHNSIHDNNSHLPSLLAAFGAFFRFGSLSVVSLSLSDAVTDVDGTQSLSLFGTMGRFRVPFVLRKSCHSLFMGVDLDFSIRSRNTEQRFVTTNMHGSYELWTK